MTAPMHRDTVCEKIVNILGGNTRDHTGGAVWQETGLRVDDSNV